MEEAGGGSLLGKSSKKRYAVELAVLQQVQREVAVCLLGQCYLHLVFVGRDCQALRPRSGAVPGAEGRDTGMHSLSWDFSMLAAS